MATVARHIWFSGRVQGVGFRWTAQRIASRYELTGYVRNLDDGRVEMVAQGELEDIENCIRDIKETFGSYLRDTEIDSQSVLTNYKSFEITF
jgi:acylphosphatase